MEHILISPGKLKLTLTRSDVERYDLDAVAYGEKEQVSRGALRELFSDLKNVAGFDAESERVFVQMYPSKDGGAELYITRLGRNDCDKEGNGTVKIGGVAVFSELCELLNTCSCLLFEGEPKTSTAWHGEGRYYLVWDDEVDYRDYLRGDRKARISHIVENHGCVIRDSAASSYVKEYCRCLCSSDAVRTLGSLA